jgi:hypothetical protein
MEDCAEHSHMIHVFSSTLCDRVNDKNQAQCVVSFLALMLPHSRTVSAVVKLVLL